jgi:SAM-dependent methyltransferase
VAEHAFEFAGYACAFAILISVAVTIWQFPRDTDFAASFSDPAVREYYEQAYAPEQSERPPTAFEERGEYVRMARQHAAKAGVPEMIDAFVRSADLESSRVLEVGSGSGLLQGAVPRYVAMDLSAGAAPFLRKPFVAASATHIPFADNSFDAAWSVWVLEHVHQPEMALGEIRRVVRDGGYILLYPAWNCEPWDADGYEVRPYGELDWRGKLIKATVPIRASRGYAFLHSRQVRAIRAVQVALGRRPSRLRYARLKPNYSKYWVTDSDAVVSLDFFEFALWFSSRGDTCIGCPSITRMIFGPFGRRPKALIVKVNKKSEPALRSVQH